MILDETLSHSARGRKEALISPFLDITGGIHSALILPCATLVHNQGTYSILLRSLVTNKDLGWVQRMICWYPTLEEITVVAKDEPNQYFRLDNGTWCHEWDWEKNLLLEGCLEFWEEAVRRGRIPKERRSHRSML